MRQLRLHDAVHRRVVRLHRLLGRHVGSDLLGVGDHRQQVAAGKRGGVVITHTDIAWQQEGVGNALPQVMAAEPFANIDAVVADDVHLYAINRSNARMVNQVIDLGIEDELTDQPAAVASEAFQMCILPGEQLVVINVVAKFRPFKFLFQTGSSVLL